MIFTLHAWLNSRLGKRITVALFAVMLLSFAAPPLCNYLFLRAANGIKDYQLWYDTGRLVLEGKEIYPTNGDVFPFMYPPSCAALLAILSCLGTFGLVASLVALNCATWIGSIALSLHLVTGRILRQEALLLLFPVVVTAPYVWGTFLLGQPSCLLLACMLGGFACLRVKRPIWAGALMALAAAIKAFPLMAIGYLIYRRYWSAAASMLLALALLLLVLPAPFRGWHRSWDDMKVWTNGMVLKYDSRGIAQREGRGNSWRNQSLMSVFNRLLRHIDSSDGQKPGVYVNVADLEFRSVNMVIAATALLLGLGYIGGMPSNAARTRETDNIEFALLLLLMLMFAPLCFGYMFVWLLFPLMVAAQVVLDARPARRALLFAWLATIIGLLILTIAFRKSAQAYGNVFFAALILSLGLGVRLWTLKFAREPAGLQGKGVSRTVPG